MIVHIITACTLIIIKILLFSNYNITIILYIKVVCSFIYLYYIFYKLIVVDRVVDGGEFIEALGGFFGFLGCCP